MIQLPRRSVTRFFIPLIDVLTLLFCIFLVMPFVKATGDAQDQAAAARAGGPLEPADPLARPEEPLDGDRLAAERAQVQTLERELQRLRAEQIETLQHRLAIRVLEIDPDTGRLYYNEPEQRVEITSQAEARALIERQKREAPGRELYYLFLFPRRVTGYPQERQLKQYERWFEGVAHGIDNPRGKR